MRYDIHHTGASGVIGAAQREASGYEDDTRRLGTTLAAAERALAHSEVVVTALQEYLQSEASARLAGVADHTASALIHTRQAIAAYEEGSVEMAATAARAAATAEVPTRAPGTGGLR